MWSPHLYKKNGLASGHSEQVLEAAISQSDSIITSNYNLPSVLTLNHLSKRTGVNYRSIRCFVNRGEMEGVETYERFSIRKRSGGRRFIHVPCPELKQVQSWINEYILKKIPVHPASYAFTAGSSIKKCALKHCGAKWLIKLDITDFFGSVSEIQVFRLFKEFGYQPLVAFELARLCTAPSHPWSPRAEYSQWHSRSTNSKIPEYDVTLLGYLPQGGVTSPLLSNLVMRTCDEKITRLAKEYSLNYTRYSDDLGFSTRSNNFSRSKAKAFICEVYKILTEAGYRPQFRKTNVIPPGGKKIILSLNVDGDIPRLQKEYKDRIRQHIYYIEKFGLDEHIANRGFDSIWGFKCHLKGMIDYAKMIEPEYGKTLLQKYSHIDWPV